MMPIRRFATNWTNLSDVQRRTCANTPCFLKLGFVPRHYLIWLLQRYKFVPHFSEAFLAHSSFDFQDVGDDWLSETKAAPNHLQAQLWLIQENYNDSSIQCFTRCSPCCFILTPLITVVDPTFIIVFALKLQLACHYNIESSFLTRPREQWGNHKFWGNVIHKNIILRLNKSIWIHPFLIFYTSFMCRNHHFPLAMSDKHIASCRKTNFWCIVWSSIAGSWTVRTINHIVSIKRQKKKLKLTIYWHVSWSTNLLCCIVTDPDSGQSEPF